MIQFENINAYCSTYSLTVPTQAPLLVLGTNVHWSALTKTHTERQAKIRSVIPIFGHMYKLTTTIGVLYVVIDWNWIV